MILAYAYFVLVTVLSLVEFVAFGIDRRRAVKGSRNRISEKRLLLIALLGGWLGAILGQQFFRHKTNKLSFRMVLLLICAVHVGLIATVLYFRWQ